MTGESYTWQEIQSQPRVWRATLGEFETRKTALQEFLGQVDFEQILVVGCGSTYYLAQAAAAILTHGTGIPSRGLPSSELWLFPSMVNTDRALLLAVSRSGRTTETLRALESFQKTKAGLVVAVTCYPESPLAQQADFVLVAREGQEDSIAQTRSFTSMLLSIQALTAALAGNDGMLERLHRLPDLLEGLVSRLGDLPQRLGADQEMERFFFLGGGPLYGLANEAMLKTKEMSLSCAEAFHSLEFRHGPMSMVNDRTLVVGLLSDTALVEEIRVLKELRALGARTLALAEDGAVFFDWRADHIVELQSGLNEWERGPLYLPVVQRLAYHRAVAKGLDPDRPKNLEAVVQLCSHRAG